MPFMRIYVDYHRLYYIIFAIITLFMTDINSKTSTHWFLNEIKEQVVPGLIRRSEQSDNCQNSENKRGEKNCFLNSNISFQTSESEHDFFGYKIMQILSDTSRIHYDNDTWEVLFSSVKSNMAESTDVIIDEEDQIIPKEFVQTYTDINILKLEKDIHIPTEKKKNSFIIGNSEPVVVAETQHEFQRQTLVITCFPYVNQTQYDHLNGVNSRATFKYYPEPEVALMFGKTTDDSSKIEVNLKNVIIKLLDDKVKRPKSPNVFNNIGNLLRIHGESREAVECFRYALKLSPHNPDVLLNLARVLYNQNFLDDAIYLTRHSLQTQPRNRNPWLHHFTLGEFLRFIGQKQEAQYHFIQSLEFNPDFAPAKDYLKEFSHKSNAINIVYSFCFSVFLLSLVLYVAFLNLEFYHVDNENQKSHRHFNRGMAMKALKTFNNKSRSRRTI